MESSPGEHGVILTSFTTTFVYANDRSRSISVAISKHSPDVWEYNHFWIKHKCIMTKNLNEMCPNAWCVPDSWNQPKPIVCCSFGFKTDSLTTTDFTLSQVVNARLLLVLIITTEGFLLQISNNAARGLGVMLTTRVSWVFDEGTRRTQVATSSSTVFPILHDLASQTENSGLQMLLWTSAR